MSKTLQFSLLTLLIIGFSAFIYNSSIVSAEVKHPYIVDEKSQVLFGDTIATSTYKGLENYKQDYVAGYAYVSFTATHSQFAYASYPPYISVNGFDPRTTPFPNQKYVATFYEFLGIGIPSDWYSTDIQFDSSGYTIIVKRADTGIEMRHEHIDVLGISDSDWVFIANDYPFAAVFPAGPSDYSVSFVPFLIKEEIPACCSNVLFIPGLEGSRLYEKKTVLGILVEDQLWEPNFSTDIDDLFLNSNGSSIFSIYTKDVIDTGSLYGFFPTDIYKSLISNLNNLVLTNKIKSWKPYSYDWRQGIDDLIQNGTKYDNGETVFIISTLQSLVDSSKTGKVTIITHSNGGLLAKALIEKLQDMKSIGQSDLLDHIDNLVMVAVPQLGTPDAFSGILHGYNQQIRGNLMSKEQARRLAQNMPSAYGLLPSKKYFEQINIKPLSVFASNSPQIYKNAYGGDITNYTEEHNFVLGLEGRVEAADSDLISPLKGNSLLLSQAETLHDSIDNMVIPGSIKVIDIAGWGKETVGGITYTGKDIEPIFTMRGDHTVVSASVLYGQGEKYWLDLTNSKLNHENIFEDSQLLDFINNIINKQPLQFSIITTSEPQQLGNRLHFGVHSPVSIGVYDIQGNFTGKVCDDVTGSCVVEENIPGSSYYEFGEGKYVNLGEGNLQKAVLQGTGVGTFTFNSEVVSPNGQTNISSFVDIPVTTETQAEITLNQTTNIPELKLDVTGDGVVDFTLAPSVVFDPIAYLQIMKTTINSLDLTQAKKDALGKRIDNTIKLIQKGKIDKAKLKAEKFVTAMNKVLQKPDPKKPRPKNISKADAQVILDMLNGLLDNLG